MTDDLWKSDLGNGVYRNPVLFADYSDPDAIRVRDTYYLTASSFNYTPGLPILESKDLVNWKLVQYAVERIPYPDYDRPQHGRGIWAPSIRYRQGWFYIFYGMPDEGIFMVRAKDPLGVWDKPRLVLEGRGLIDPCPFWEEDGEAYVVHAYAKSRIGFNSVLGIFPISEDGFQATGEDRLIFDGTRTQKTIEGPKVYKRGEWYYIFAPAGGVKQGWQTVLRSRSLYGPYEERVVMKQGDTPVNGPHQGALVDTPDGENWFLHFQDKGAFGRILHLQPVCWRDGWPIIGEEKEGCPWGQPCLFHKKPSLTPKSASLTASDDFEAPVLGLQWQWLGNADESFYSLKDRPGFLRLYSRNPSGEKPAVLWNCANVLTQKILCPSFTMETAMELKGLRENERAGVVVIGGSYAWLGVEDTGGVRRVAFKLMTEEDGLKSESAVEEHSLSGEARIVFRIRVKSEKTVSAVFSYSADGEHFTQIFRSFVLTPNTWVGARTGLFAVASDRKQHSGYADFAYVRYTGDGCGYRPEFQLAEAGDLEMIRCLAEHSKISMDIRDGRHRTLLHYAAQSGNAELVRYLTERVGLSPLEGDCDRITPYELARESCKRETEAYFKEYCGASLEEMYKNPVRTGMYPDPSVVRVGEDYYMVNSTFVYFPCIPVSHSKDLLHWNIVGYAVTNSEWAALGGLEGGHGYWAPDISFWDGRFYITATYRMNDGGTVTRRQLIVSSERPEGPYGKPVFLDEDGIDPSLFHDDDGRHYMLLNRGARILELNGDMTAAAGKAELLYYGDCKRAPEGPHLLKKDGYYYLFLAEGGTGMGHRITAARSKSLKDPFEPCPYNPILRQTDSEAVLQRCGHGKPVQTQNGEWFMVYLCGRVSQEGKTLLGRETALDPIFWTADGWPLVNRLRGPSVLQKKPDLPEQPQEDEKKGSFMDFHSGGLSLEWMTPRGRNADNFSSAKDGFRLTGDSFDLDSLDARSIFLRRQCDLVFEAGTLFSMPVCENGEDAGLTGYYDENSWFKFGVRRVSGTFEVFSEENRGGERTSEKLLALGDAPDKIALKIRADGLSREVFFQQTDGVWQFLKGLPNVDYLCDEGCSFGKRFTGPTVGIYVHGRQTVLFRDFWMEAEDGSAADAYRKDTV